MYKLSRRMQLIFDHLIPGEPVWDFCCDHGYMGLNAYESGLFPEVYFVDQVEHIIASLRARFEREYFRAEGAQAHFFPTPGGDVPVPLKGSVVVAGVGAHTIFSILKKLHGRGFLHASRLILCPQRDHEKLREFLAAENDFGYRGSLTLREVEERGRKRKLLIFDKI